MQQAVLFNTPVQQSMSTVLPLSAAKVASTTGVNTRVSCRRDGSGAGMVTMPVELPSPPPQAASVTRAMAASTGLNIFNVV